MHEPQLHVVFDCWHSGATVAHDLRARGLGVRVVRRSDAAAERELARADARNAAFCRAAAAEWARRGREGA